MAETPLQILDLTGAVDRRPLIKFDFGEFQMLLMEELTFAQFSEQAAIGKKLVSVADDVDKPGVLEELHVLVMKGVQMILVDMDDDEARQVTPGQFLKITSFFNSLDVEAETTPGESGLSAAPDASDSLED